MVLLGRAIKRALQQLKGLRDGTGSFRLYSLMVINGEVIIEIPNSAPGKSSFRILILNY